MLSDYICYFLNGSCYYMRKTLLSNSSDKIIHAFIQIGHDCMHIHAQLYRFIHIRDFHSNGSYHYKKMAFKKYINYSNITLMFCTPKTNFLLRAGHVCFTCKILEFYFIHVKIDRILLVLFPSKTN